MTKDKYVTKGFYGTVFMKDWLRTVECGNVLALRGIVTVLKDEEIVDFKVKGTESNWVARIVGENNEYTILGCKVKGFCAHSKDSLLPSDHGLVG